MKKKLVLATTSTPRKKAFDELENYCERAIFLMFATSGLRLSELWNLKKDDIDFESRCIKSKHDTRTKRAGVTFYNSECEKYLKRYLASRQMKATDCLLQAGPNSQR